MEDVPELERDEEEEKKEENTLDSLLVENLWLVSPRAMWLSLFAFFIFTSTLDILGTEVEQQLTS